jgi:hypothetical protein
LDESHLAGSPEENFPGICTEGTIILEAMDAAIGYVGGTALDKTGQPMSNTTVIAVRPDGQGKPDTGVANFLYVTNESGRFCLPIQAELSAQLVGFAGFAQVVQALDAGVCGIVPELVDVAVKQWLFADLEVKCPSVGVSRSSSLRIKCPGKVPVGLPSWGDCRAFRYEFVEYTCNGVRSGNLPVTYQQDVTGLTSFHKGGGLFR